MNIDFIINFICFFLIFFALITLPLLIYKLVNADKDEDIKENKIIKILKEIINITLLFIASLIVMLFLICNNVLV